MWYLQSEVNLPPTLLFAKLQIAKCNSRDVFCFFFSCTPTAACSNFLTSLVLTSLLGKPALSSPALLHRNTAPHLLSLGADVLACVELMPKCFVLHPQSILYFHTSCSEPL